jgi:molecular chaperone GrpE
MEEHKEGLNEEFEDISFGSEDATTAEKSGKKEKKSRKDRKNEAAFADMKAKNEELNDKYLRLFSDFDNFRKRTLKEKTELTKTATEDLIKNLLIVVDDMERAIEMAPNDSGINSLTEGVVLIYNKLMKTLKDKGLEEIHAKGQDFDTDFHEALTNIPAPDPSQKGKVIDVIQKGYTLGGKVIRFARVVVGN